MLSDRRPSASWEGGVDGKYYRSVRVQISNRPVPQRLCIPFGTGNVVTTNSDQGAPMTTATIPTTRTRSQQRIEFLGDVLVSACIGYWSREVSTTARGGLRVIDLDGASHDITLDTVARGLAAVAEGRANYCNLGYADTKTRIALLNRTNGVEGDYDAIDADYIVQIGTYGEVVWS